MPPGSRQPDPVPSEVDRAERDRIERVYAGYRVDPRKQEAWADTPASRFISDTKWERIRASLSRLGIGAVAGWAVDLGSWDGKDSARLAEAGAAPAKILAMDILSRQAAVVRRDFPWMSVVVADASKLPIRDRSAGLVYQSTMLSSIPDARRRRTILAEARRVLRPGGVFLSYDMRYPSPRNPNVGPVRLRELAGAFAGWEAISESITALPPLLRLLAPASTALCRACESIPFLRSHRLFLAVKPAGAEHAPATGNDLP
jgi:SAM-dependent methyltransferase